MRKVLRLTERIVFRPMDQWNENTGCWENSNEYAIFSTYTEVFPGLVDRDWLLSKAGKDLFDDLVNSGTLVDASTSEPST